MKFLSKTIPLLMLIFIGCAHYMIRTNFYTLQQGISKQEFLDSWQKSSSSYKGGHPSSSRTFKIDGNTWEILIYDVYNEVSLQNGYPSVDHHEFVAFKNGILVEWGNGNMPLTLQNKPNIIDINTENEPEFQRIQNKKTLEQQYNVISSNIKNIAISSFDARGMSSADAVTVADFIRTDIVRKGSYTVMDRNNMEIILSEQKFQLSGCTTQECAVKLGKVLNVQGIVVGSISKLMGQIVISVSLVNVETGKIEFSCDTKANNFDDIREACKKIANQMSN